MDIILTLLFWCVWGAICYKIAEHNGRDTTIAAILGVIFGLFAVLGYWIAGKPKETE